jgi:excinuclease ABC subunit A
VVEKAPKKPSKKALKIVDVVENALATDKNKKEVVASSTPIVIEGACGYNLKNISVTIPTKQLVCVTGVSGAGKTSLMVRTLLGDYLLNNGELPSFEVLPCTTIDGMAQFEEVVYIDQSTPMRSLRSSPITITKAYDDIRTLLARTDKAKALNLSASDFSYNSYGGRCEQCEGLGFIEIDMQFMANVTLTCPGCNGQRFNQTVLSVELEGHSVLDILNLSIDKALSFFSQSTAIKKKLQPLFDLGLGYLTLGQSTATLSGGEAQRLKLSTQLPLAGSRSVSKKLFIFEEPTIGLHLTDVQLLVNTLRQLVTAGHSVIVIEHNLAFIQWAADWLIDLGPEAGEAGGTVLYNGVFDQFVAKCPGSLTARQLQQDVKR